MPTHKVVPTESQEALIETLVESGRCANANEVFREGLRLLEEQETKLAKLRAALIEGETSGEWTAFDFEAFLARKRSEAGMR